MPNPSVLASDEIESNLPFYNYDKYIADAARKYLAARHNNAFERTDRSFNAEARAHNYLIAVVDAEKANSNPADVRY